MGLFKKLKSVVGLAVIGAAVATGLGLLISPTMVAGTAAFGLTGTAAFFAANTAINFVLGAASTALTKKPSSGTQTALANNGQTISQRNPLGAHKVIYGRTRVGGNILYMATTPDNVNTYLHLVIALAGHEIDAVEAFYANETAVALDAGGVSTAASAYGTKLRVLYQLGTTDQTAFADLVSETSGLGAAAWTSAHRVRGSALAYVRLQYDQDKFPNGIPNFSFLVRGKKVYDPRTATTAWSANPALIVNDYLTSAFGLGCAYASEIDAAALTAAANACDVAVPLAAGGSEATYAAHGVFATNERPDEIINKLLTAMAGRAVWTQGKWRILAGSYTAPTLTYDEDDLRAGFKVQTLVSRRENFNTVKGVFSAAADNYIVTDFPQVSSATAIAADGGETVIRSIELPFTTSSSMAQRLAKIDLLRARQQITLTLPLKLSGLKANVGDIVAVTNARMGWAAKAFEVTNLNMVLGEVLGVDLELREIASDVYAWATSEEQAQDPAPNTNLPDPFTVATPGIPSVTESIYQTRAGAGVKAKAVLTTSTNDAFIRECQFESRTTGASSWTVLGNTSGLSFEVLDIAAGRYDFRVKAINMMGVSSAYATASNVEIVGLAAAPAALAGLSVQAAGGLAILNWTLASDLDVRLGGKIRVRHSASLAGATWDTSTSIGEAVAGNATVAVLPLKSGTYLLKAEDALGIQSATATSISTKQAALVAFSTLSTAQEDDDFTGTHTDTVVETVDAATYLQLESIGLIDAQADFDAIDNLAAIGGIQSSGTYDFATGIDLGSVKRVRLTSTVVAQIINALDMIDTRSGNLDTWANFDGTAAASADAWVEVRETDDNPAGTPTWSAWKRLDASEFDARGFDFRARLTTTDPAYNIQISQLRVAAAEII